MPRRRPFQKFAPLRGRTRDSRRRLLYQTLEQRQLLAVDGPRLVGVSPNAGELFDPRGTTVLNVSPSEVVVRFDGGQQLNPTTLAGIQLVRSGNDGQIDVDDHAQDVVIQPGFVGFGDSQREVILRFAEPLPDDSYALEIFGFDDVNRGIVGLRNLDGFLFQPSDTTADRELIPFQVELGAQITAVVPQPVRRDSNGDLQQQRNQIIVYFNNDDLVNQLQLPLGQSSIRTSEVTTGPLPTVIDPRFYQLVLTRQTVSGNDDVVVLPTEIEYDPALDRAILTFAEDQNGAVIADVAEIASAAGVSTGDGTFRLRVGDDAAVSNTNLQIRPRIENLLGSDTGSSFDASDATTLGALASGATLIHEQIRATDSYALNYPGAFDEPGSREVLEQNHLHTSYGDRDDGTNARAISTLYYNFDKSNPYGVSDNNGQLLFNAITPLQEQRAREIFEQFGELWGIDFIETDTNVVDGVEGVSLTVVVGDLVVFGGFGSTNQSGPGGVFGGVAQTRDDGLGGTHTFGRRIALLDRGESWFNERGVPESTDISRLSFYAHAMNVIGSALGVGAASDQPPGTAISGVVRNVTLGGEIDLLTSNPVEPALPGDSDNVHGRYLYRPESRDIDVYQFSVAAGEVGTFSAEIFAERLHESASLLDSRLALYGGDGSLLATNDDYYGEDSFLQFELGQGNYYLAVSASGNDQYNLNVNNSGMGGTSEGRYDVLVNFVTKADASIVDTSGTAIDGDGDGVAGGVFHYWFRATSDVGQIPDDTARRPSTLFVDKSHTPALGAGIAIGSRSNPYNNIEKALAGARQGDVVRIVGNRGLDGDLSTIQDSFAYEIGRGGDQDAPLSDGLQLDVPAGVHLMIDAGAVFKLRNSRIGVGSSTTVVDRSGGSLQVLGTPFLSGTSGDPLLDGDGQRLAGSVIFTSYNDESLGVDTNPLNTTPIRGEWGGIEFRNDVDRSQGRVDLEQQGIFLNYVAQGDFRYGGGQVDIDSQTRVINPIHLTASRPSILENTITLSADAAISADPESFEETNFNSPRYQQNDLFVSDYDRVGPDFRGNYLVDNSTNGLFVRVDTLPGQPTQMLTVPARFDDRDIVHFIGDTLIVQGTPGGPRLESLGASAAAITSVASLPPVGTISNLNTTAAAVTYTYRLSSVDAYGGESAASGITVPVSVAPGQQVRLSNLPPAQGDFVGRRVYRSQPGGRGPFSLVANIDRNSLVFTDLGQSTGATLTGARAVADPAAGGGFLPGTQLEYRFTLVDDLGNEFLVDEPSVTVSVGANQQVRLSHLPGNNVSVMPGNEPDGLVPDHIVSRRVYRSVDGADSFRLVRQTDLRSEQIVDNGLGGSMTLLPSGLPEVHRTRLRSRPDARLAIDPGVVVKLEGTRIETGFGAQLIAEGVDGQPVVFTSRADDRFGAGGTFDTNNDQHETQPEPGDWGGLYISPAGSVSLDYALVTHGGGEVATGGAFAGFNPLEIVQAEGRVTNSTFENNASGLGTGQSDQQRDGHGFNEPAAIFIRGAQPIIVNNVIRDNAVGLTAAISVNVNALNSDLISDPGRQTGAADRFADIRGNQGPLIRQNLIGGNSINGLAIRGGTLTTESVWDDTDIVHVLANLRPDLQVDLNGVPGPETILIPDFHTYGGLRLESGSTQSLVVKFDQDAGITANGRPLDIEDRIGGTLQVVGSPGFPVVLTSLSDDDVGAGFDPKGLAQTDTNGDAASQGTAGDWMGLLLDQFSNDRNVAIVNERESPTENARPDSVRNNSIPGNAEFLGALAADERNGDDNLRLGFTVNGLINRPGDIDVYSFRGTAGSEVWLDIDRTASSLDTIIELISSNGDILALSDNSYDESIGGITLLANESLLPSDQIHVLQKDAFGGFNSLDASFRDDYTTNLRDAGLRVVLPGTAGASSTYFVRVRSNNQDPLSPQPRDIDNVAETPTPIAFEGGLVGDGKTSGVYELQIRLRATQEQDGSTVRFSDIRYATSGIVARGLPGHSPLLGEAAEDLTGADNNNTFDAAPDLGSLYATDRGALSVAARMAGANDVDWFQFRLEQDSIDPRVTGSYTTPIILDIDYADGIGRPNTTIWLYNANGQLVSFGTDSNIADDQPGPFEGVDQDDLSRGSAGPLDAWIGSLELPAGDYFVAVTNNSQVSQLIQQYQIAGVSAADAVVRVEPVSSVRRIASDHDFNDDGRPDNYTVNGTQTNWSATAQPPITVAFDGNNNRIDYTLGDVVLFVTVNNGNNSLLRTVDPFTGQFETEISQSPRVVDIAMRPDGLLYGTGAPTNGPFNDDRFDDVYSLDTAGDGTSATVGSTGIQTNEQDTTNAARATTDTQAGNPRPRNGDGLEYGAITFVGADGNNTDLGRSASGLAMLAVAERIEDPLDPGHDGSWLFRLDPTTGAGVSAPANNRTANGVLAGAGTQVVERGFIDTLTDNSANNTTPVLTTTSGSATIDGQSVRVGTTRFELDSGLIATVAPGAAGSMTDGDVIHILDSTGATRRLEIDFGRRLQIVDPALVGDGQSFTLTTASGTVLTFEFASSADPDLSDPRHIRIPTSIFSSELAENIRNAVNGLGLSGVTAVRQGAVIDFTGQSTFDISGIAGLAPSGDSGASAGRVAVPVRMGMTDVQLTQAIADTINGPSVSDRLAVSAVGTTLAIGGGISLSSAPNWLTSTLASRVGSNYAESIVDGQTMVIRDSNGNDQTIEFDLGALLQITDPAEIVDGDTIAVTIGGTTTTFEFDDLSIVIPPTVPPTVPPPLTVTAGNVAIDFDSTSPFTTATLAQAIASAAADEGIQAVIHPVTGTEIDFIGDTALVPTSAALDTVGTFGSSQPVRVRVDLDMQPAQVAAAIAAVVDGTVLGGAITMTANGTVLQIEGGDRIVDTPVWLSRPGVVSTSFPVAFSSTDSDGTVAQALVGAMRSRGVQASYIDNVVYITGGTAFAVGGSSMPFGQPAQPAGGSITGMAPVEIGNQVHLFAVSDAGGLFEITTAGGDPFGLSSSRNQSDFITTISSDTGSPAQFAGLTVGPRNVNAGDLSQILFGVTTAGEVIAFDTTGRPAGVFMDGARSVRTGQTGVTGLAFSNLDVNLWHVSNTRGADAGHGVQPSPDHNDLRSPAEPNASNNSLYFGFENPRSSGGDIQAGEWRGIYDVGNTNVDASYAGDYLSYNFPGGAEGTMESNPIDLSGYAAEDLPTLYFSYYLQTENANSDLIDNTSSAEGNMQDAFRIFAAGEDGYWQLLGTNNSESDRALRSPVEYQDEFDEYASGGTEQVQELYDVGDGGAPDAWRQARIPLEAFAGQKNVRIRVDFSTAAASRLGHPMLGGEELRAVAGSSIRSGDLLTLDPVAAGPDRRFEFDMGLDLQVPSGANINAGDFFWVDGQQYVFVNGPAGNNQIPFADTDSAVVLAQRIRSQIEFDGYNVFVHPDQPNRLNVTGAQTGFAAPGLPADFVLSQPGVAVGNTPIEVHVEMSFEEVAEAVQQAFASALNEAGSENNTDTYQVRNDYMLSLYGYQVTDPGPLGLTRHGVEQQPFYTITPGANGFDFRLPGEEFGLFTNPSRNNPGSLRGRNNLFEGVYIDDVIIGFRERGEMVLGAGNGQTTFVANLEYEPWLQAGRIDETELGTYQLEIRRGAGYAQDRLDGGNQDSQPFDTFDTNDRLANAVAMVAPAAALVADGQTFTVSDGTDVVTFELDDLTLPAGDPNVGVASGHVIVPFDPSMVASEMAQGIRDAINSNAAQTRLDVVAALSDGSTSGATTPAGNPSTSHLVYLHGSATADAFGSLDFGDLNNNGDAPFSRWHSNDDIIRFDRNFFPVAYLGDQNVFRDQGQVLLEGNVVTEALQFGISVLPGLRDRQGLVPLSGVLPHPGAPRQTLEINHQNLAPGVTVFNNVLNHNGLGGIEIRGETDAAGAAMTGAVPFARVVNNTVFGDGTGTGILVADNASPTLLNNIVVNMNLGISVDASSDTAVMGTSLFQDNATDSNFAGGNLGAFPITLASGQPLFVDPSSGNFYLADNSLGIDSSLASFADRTYFITIKQPLGIGQSPIIAPPRDITGQLRVDDPNVNTPAGIGQNVFVDRGAIDRSDFVGPTAALLKPQDNDLDGDDQDDSTTFVRVSQGTLDFFELVLVESNGTGPDVQTVTGDAVTVTEDGQLLEEGVDYTFGFSATNRTIRLTPLSAIWRPDSAYEITLNNRDRIVLEAPEATDIVDGDQFTITDTMGTTATFEYDTGYLIQIPQTLLIDVPAGQGSGGGFGDGEKFSITAPDGTVVTFEIATVDRGTGTNVRVLLNPGDTAEEVREAIFGVLVAQSAVLDLAPQRVGQTQIQIGSQAGHAVDPLTSPLTVSGVDAGISDGDSLTYSTATETFVIEFDNDGVSSSASADALLSFDRTDTPEVLAAKIADTLNASGLGLIGVRPLEQGILALGGRPGDVLTINAASITQLGQPGVDDALLLTFPAALVAEDYEDKTVSLTVNGLVTVFEFSLDSNRLPGTQLIILQPGQDAAAVAARFAQAVDAAIAGLAPAVVNASSIRLGEPVGSSIDLSNSPIVSSGVAGGATAVALLPSSTFSRDIVAGQLLAAIAASPLNSGVFAPGGGDLYLDNTLSVTGAAHRNLTGIKDLAGNNLQPNRINAETQFTILMPGVELDFGDAPSMYELNTNGSFNPARHTLSGQGQPRLGPAVDAETANPDPASDDLSPSIFAFSAAQTFVVSGGGATAQITVGPDDAAFAPLAGQTVSVTVGPRTFVFELSTDGNVTVPGAIAVFFDPAAEAPAVADALAVALRRVAGDPVVVSLETDRQNEVRMTLVDDEDGVAIGPFQTVNSPAAVDGIFLDPTGGFLGFLNPSDPIGTALSVTVTGSGLLDAWVDFNQDGDWNDPAEQILANQAVLPGDNRLLVKTPSTAIDGLAWARFRLSTTGNQLPRGVAIGGEVEDYQVRVASVVLPEPVDDAYALGEDSVLTVGDSDQGVLFRVDQPDVLNGLLNPSVEILNDVTFGSLTLASDGSFHYAPFEDFFGADTFTYQIVGEQRVDPADPNSPLLPIRSSKVGTVTITVNPENDPPSAVAQLFRAIEPSDTTGTSALTIAASDLLAGALPQADADLRLPPFDEKEQTLTVIQIRVHDATGALAPVVPMTGAIPVDGVYVVDTFVGGLLSGTMTVTVAAAAVTQVVYQPADEYNEDNPRVAGLPSLDGFEYTVTDDGKATLPSGVLADPQLVPKTVTATASIQIYPQNDPPVGVEDLIPGPSWTGARPTEDTPLVIPRAFLLSNDVVGPAAALDELNGLDANDGIVFLADDPTLPGLPTSFAPFPLTTAQGGTVALDAAGELVYSPAADYFGPDSFVYFVGDQGISEDASGVRTATPKYTAVTVSMVVDPVNDAPLAIDHGFQTIEDQSITITAADLLAAAVAHGDPQLPSAPWDETNQLLRVIALDVGGQSLTAANAGSGQRFLTAHGEVTATFDATGALLDLQFIPNTDFNLDNPLDGSGLRTIEQFSYTIADDGIATLPQGGTAVLPDETWTAVVRIEVTPQNDVPDVGADRVQAGSPAWDQYFTDRSLPIPVPTEDDASLTIPAEFLLLNDHVGRPTAADERLGTNANDGVLSIVQQPLTTSLGGTVSFDASGDLVYVPPADLYGLDTFVYTVTDQGVHEAIDGTRTPTPLTWTATVTIDLTPVNDVPSAPDRQYTIVESGEVGQNVTFNFSSDDLIFGALPAADDDALPGDFADTLGAPYDESAQTLRVVQFTTSAGTVDVADLAGGSGTVTLATAAGGTLTLNFVGGGFVDGSYVPAEDSNQRTPFVPTDQFTYLISDDGQTTSPDDGPVTFLADQRALTVATVTLTVTETNDPPEFDFDATVEILERDDSRPNLIAGFIRNVLPGPATALDELDRQSVTFAVPAALGSDPDGIMLRDPIITPLGELVIFPTPDAVGQATYVVRALDDDPLNPRFADVTVTINLRPVNDRPEPNPSFSFPTIVVDEDLLGSDPSGGPLVIPVDTSQLSELLNAFLAGPANELDGTLGGGQTMQVVNPVPVTTTRGGTVQVMTDPLTGMITHLLYTPLPHFNDAIGGSDSFGLTLRDDGRTWNLDPTQGPLGLHDDFLTVTTGITISVTPRNDAPTFTAVDSLDVLERDDLGAYTLAWASDILVGPSNPTTMPPQSAADELASQIGSFEIVPLGDPALHAALLNGPLSVSGDGTMRFTPQPDAVGSLQFAITLVDSGVHDPAAFDLGRSITKTLTLTLRPVNDDPRVVGGPITAQTLEDTPVTFAADPNDLANSPLLQVIAVGPANEADATDGGNQRVTITDFDGFSAHGGRVTPVFDTSGTVIVALQYQPATDYNDLVDGVDTFTYTVSDDGISYLEAGAPNDGQVGGIQNDPKTVRNTITISLAPVNDTPQFIGGGSVTVIEDSGQDVPGVDPADVGLAVIPNWAMAIFAGPTSAQDERHTATGQQLQFEITPLNAAAADALFDPLAMPVAAADGTLTFRTLPDAVGSVEFTVQLVDDGDTVPPHDHDSDVRTFTISVTPVNDPPTFVPGPDVTVLEDHGAYSAADPWATSILPGPSDEVDAGQTVHFLVATPAASQSLFTVLPAVSDDGLLTFALRPDANGEAVVTVTPVDSEGLAGQPHPLTLTVSPTDDAPIAAGDLFNTDEDVVLKLLRQQLLANDVDVDLPADSLQLIAIAGVSARGAAITVNGAGDVLYDPSGSLPMQQMTPGQSLVDSFTYQLQDAAGLLSSVVTVTLNVAGRNDAPTVHPDLVPINLSGATTIRPLDNDSDVDGTIDPTTLEITDQPDFGAVTISADGTVNYSAFATFPGDDVLSYVVKDNLGQKSVQTTITISANLPPTFTAGPAVTVAEDSGAYAVVGAWATDIVAGPDAEVQAGQTVRFDVSVPSQSQAMFSSLPVVSDNGFLTFAVADDASGQVAVTVTPVDSAGAAGQPHTLTITIAGSNDPPIAVGDLFDADEDTVLHLTAQQLLANDTDVDLGDTLTITGVAAESQLGVGLSIDSAGNVSYDPTASADLQSLAGGETRTDRFTYQLRDAAGGLSDVVTVTVNLAGRNDAPTANDDFSVVAPDGTTVLNPLDNDTDVDGTIDPATLRIVTQPQSGSVVAQADGTVVYTPAGEAAEQDQFTYVVADDAGLESAPATFAFGTNHPPTAVDDLALTYRDQTIDIDVMVNDGDPDGSLDAQPVLITRNPTNGTVTVLPSGVVRYVPDADFTGDDSFAYTIVDRQGLPSPEGNVVVRVAGSRLQNPAADLVADVNADGRIEALDALLVINFLNSGRPTTVSESSAGPLWYDVDGNGEIQPLDALRIINAINRQSRGQQSRGLQSTGSGEGEGIPTAAVGATPPISTAASAADSTAHLPTDAAPVTVADAPQRTTWEAGEAPQRSVPDDVLHQLARRQPSGDTSEAIATVDRLWNDFGQWE